MTDCFRVGGYGSRAGWEGVRRDRDHGERARAGGHLSLGHESHSGVTLYISLVITYTKYTG